MHGAPGLGGRGDLLDEYYDVGHELKGNSLPNPATAF